MVLSTEFLDSINEYELFHLLLAYYFHDLGMVGKEFQFKTAEGREQIRREHAIAIESRITERWEELGFADVGEAQVLAEVCRGHRPDKDPTGHATWESMDREVIVGPGRHVRLRVLSALIYAIDELHIGADRADERLRRWIEVETEESLRHWKRHQMIQGPSLIDNRLTFTARPRTPTSEDDLRRNVFAKAFIAYSDLKREVSQAGIAVNLPDLAITWTRTDLWKLFLIESERASTGSSSSAITDDVVARFRTEQKVFLTLDSLCNESGNADNEIRNAVVRAVRDFETTNVLVQTTNADDFQLGTSDSAWKTISDVLRKADEVDHLLAGAYRATHQFSLYREDYGTRFVADQLRPHVIKHYGVDVCGPNPDDFDAMIGQVLRTSPTAARLVREVDPFHSDLIKRRLLCLATITGFSRDVLQSPELILNVKTRKAIYAISRILKDFEKSYEFFEELALLSGLSEQQVGEALLNSPDWQKEMTSESIEAAYDNIELTQTLSKDAYRPSTAFSYLLLAGQRSGAAIQLRCNHDSSITLKSDKFTHGDTPPILPVSIGIGPGSPSMLPRVDFKCDLSLNCVGKQAVFTVFPLNDASSRGKPFVVRLPSPDHAKEGTSKVQFALFLPDLTVGHLMEISELGTLFQSDDSIELQLVLAQTGERFVTLKLQEGSPFQFSLPFNEDFVQRLAKLDRTLPCPWYCPVKYETDLLTAEEGSAVQLLERLKSELKESRPEVPTFTLIIETEQGVPYREDFLRFAPGFSISPPTIESGGKYSQEEVEQMWKDRTGIFKLETYLREDTSEIAASFREWAKDPSVGFPVKIDSSVSTFHQTKTVYALELHPRVDRIWYIEAPTIIRLRPTTRKEQLQTELKYWQSRGDEPRSNLVEEKLERIEKEHGQAKK